MKKNDFLVQYFEKRKSKILKLFTLFVLIFFLIFIINNNVAPKNFIGKVHLEGIINDKIGKFKKVISVSGDKSLSIRWVLFSSLANGVSNAQNLLLSEDVLAAIKAIKTLGIKSKITEKGVKILELKFHIYYQK